ncbi:uncharacterized protein [Palaemon carinicauda]|uniref:uncharacterized protein n=1 Tax=Palaemon carinicauda TaxID=392227 RepID=UPI0035B5D86E
MCRNRRSHRAIYIYSLPDSRVITVPKETVPAVATIYIIFRNAILNLTPQPKDPLFLSLSFASLYILLPAEGSLIPVSGHAPRADRNRVRLNDSVAKFVSDVLDVVFCAFRRCPAVTALFLCFGVLVSANPGSIMDFEGDEHQHQQEGQGGEAVQGSYSWTSPEGSEFYVKYIADENGYRVVESNAIPVDADGVAADGNQGSFSGEDEGGEA